MIDVAEANARDVDISLDTIADEVKAGLPLHADRLVEAFDNEEYYAGRNAAYIARREAEDWRDYLRRPRRTSKILRKVIRALARLYAPGPHREVKGDAAADKFLDDVYQANHVDDLMMAADRKCNLNGLAAIQAHVTGRPDKPIQLYLWGAHEFAVWTLPDDPTTVWAVGTINRQCRVVGKVHQQQIRYELWSAREHRVYLSEWVPNPSAQRRAKWQYRGLFDKPAVYQRALSGLPAGSGENPYGVLPFSFVHDETPVSDIYEGGIGCALRECNAEVDRELSDLAQHAREFMDPDRFTLGVSAAWRREKRPGNWQSLTPNRSTLEDGGVQPSAFLVQAALAVDHVWYNITTYANQVLEDLDVPVAAIRADTSQHLSGVAIVAKQLPLLDRLRGRQPRFTVAEVDLARMVLTVAGLIAPGREIELGVTWPTPKFALPSPEQDSQDTWMLDNGVKSLVDVVAERGGFTTDQAKEQIVRIAADNTWLATVLVPPAPLTGLPGTISGLDAAGGGQGNLNQGK
jgi:hypothetical protein